MYSQDGFFVFGRPEIAAVDLSVVIEGLELFSVGVHEVGLSLFLVGE